MQNSHKLKTKQLFTSIVQRDIDNISETWENFEEESFESAIKSILHAKHVYIAATHESMVLGEYLRLQLHRILPDVILISTSCSGEIAEQLLHINEKDLIIGISFSPYSALTQQALEFASGKKAQIITITDHPFCPASIYSSCNLVARSELSSTMPSLTAGMVYINAIGAAIYQRKSKQANENLDTLNRFWEEYQTFKRDELNAAPDTITYGKTESDHE